MGHRFGLTVLAAAVVLPLSTAQAKKVGYPAAHPQIALEVPPDWSVAETTLGLELQSPQKDSLVLAAIMASDRKSVDGWTKRALDRMAQDGVVFAKAGTPKTAAAAAPGTDRPDAGNSPTVDSSAVDFARGNADRPYTFDGSPTIQPPKFLGEDPLPVGGKVGDVDLPTIFTPLANGETMKSSGNFVYAGGTLRGQPVDVELTVFPMGSKKRLLIEQQSGATDARGVMIVRSLRDLTQ